MKKKVIISLMLVILIIISYFSINRFNGWKKLILEIVNTMMIVI